MQCLEEFHERRLTRWKRVAHKEGRGKNQGEFPCRGYNRVAMVERYIATHVEMKTIDH